MAAMVGIVSALGDRLEDDTCLLQARINISRQVSLHANSARDAHSSRDVHSAQDPSWDDQEECKSWAETKRGDMPMFACVSTMLRTSIIRAPSNGAVDRMEDTVEPTLCKKLGINHCAFKLLAPGKFQELRSQIMPGSQHESASDILKRSLMAGPLESLSGKSGGKSDAEFMKTADGRFIIKAGLDEGITMDEVANLKKLLFGENGKTSLFKHFQDNPRSLLDRIYGMVKVQLGDSFMTSSDESIYVILEDATYMQDTAMEFLGNEVEYRRYDLKERPGVNAQHFIQSEGATMYLRPNQCDSIIQTLKADTTFLEAHGIIDYSLFVAVATSNTQTFRASRVSTVPPCPPTLVEPYCLDGRAAQGARVQYTVSIIDYLNNFNWFKKGENKVPGSKWGKFDQWAAKTVALAKEMCPPSH